MSERSQLYRAWSMECLDFAQQATDNAIRLAFLTMAQRWMDLAHEAGRPVAVQQQQQIQPREPDGKTK
jgi:hypothetical protein